DRGDNDPLLIARIRRCLMGRGSDHQYHDTWRVGARRGHFGGRGNSGDRNINSSLPQAESRARAVLDATRRTVVPRFLSMLCMVAVFVPSFLMTGVTKSLFVPLSLAVGFAMM